MLGSKAKVATVLTILVAGSLGSLDFVQEMRRDFKIGTLLPRVASNLQTFQGALGGQAAAPVRSYRNNGSHGQLEFPMLSYPGTAGEVKIDKNGRRG